MAYKVFTNGSVLQASEINDNLMRQSVMVFSNASARTAAITSPVEGMLTWLEDVNRYESYNGSAWVSPFGTTLLANSVFSGQTSVAFDNIFTSDYRFYDYFFSLFASTTTTLEARLRTGSTDLSSSTYTNQVVNVNNTVFTGARATQTSFNCGTLRVNYASSGGLITNPFIANETQLNHSGVDAGSGAILQMGASVNSSIASYNGIRFFTATGTFSGQISIFGRRS